MSRLWTAIFLLLCSIVLVAQQSSNQTVPRFVRFNGTAVKSNGAPDTAALGFRFSLYKDETGGAPLWQEVQNVTFDAAGHYSVLLGTNSKDGVPAELFTSNEARWLGVQVEQEPEQPRVLLVSVPYALKAGDAETLGGRRITDFVLAPTAVDSTASSYGSTSTAAQTANLGAVRTNSVNPASSGMQNYLAKWTDNAGTLGNSGIFEDVNGFVGIGTNTPGSKLDVQVTTPTPLNALNSAMTLTNSSPIPSDIINALKLSVVDASTATNLSKQIMRMTYVRDAAATGGVSVFDTIFTATPVINSNAPYTLIGLNMEGPTVATGKTLSTFYGALIGAGGGAGTVSNRYALVTAPGAGNVGLNTTTPFAPLHLVADNPGGSGRATQMVVQGSSNPNLKLNIGIHTEASPAYADLGLVEEGVAWRNLVLAKNGGAVGIGTTTPTSPLTVNGTIQSTSGGFKFPDGSVQATATTSSGGTITGVTAGSGLTGGGTSGNVSLSLLTSCATGQLLKWSGSTWACAADATTGGGGGATTFSSSLAGGTSDPAAAATVYSTNGAVGIQAPDPVNAIPPIGVLGMATNTSATGLTIGLAGLNKSPQGIGVFAMASGPGDANFKATALTAYAGSATGNTKAIEATADSPSGTALRLKVASGGSLIHAGAGTFSGTSGTDNFDLDTSSASFAVNSFSINGISGPSSVSINGGVNITGNLSVSGTVSKGGGSFKIDHPLDPADKFLYHSFVESPDMMNVYNGVVMLDARGQAWVQLPDYFEALNQDFRYQLTSIGRFMPVYIAKEISSNRFRIAGGRPHGRVSWQVTGIRHDAYANAHRIPVELEKSAAERSKYMHQEGLGHPEQDNVAAAASASAPTNIATEASSHR